ncbi:MAG: twin-arginine translocation signal domain-containing protein, partial [Acidimicrobiales bacterium]
MATEEDKTLDRRSFLGKAGLGVAGIAASATILAACSNNGDDGASTGDTGATETTTGDTGAEGAATTVVLSQETPEIEWEMGT